MRYLLDTSICVELIRGRAPRVFNRLRKLAVDEAGISSITLAELQYGVGKSSSPARHRELLAKFLAPLAVVPFDDSPAQAYGDLRAALEREGTPIGPLDTLIAAHAVSVNATLLTSNEREFRRVRGLRVENWLAL
jgi:tRNA(fMet)-specific endonuclease VapC